MAALDFLKKSPGILRMGVILILGVALLLFASDGKEEAEIKSDAEELSAYGTALEERLTALCAEVSGVGRVRVMVTLESGAQAQYKGSVQIATLPPRVLGVCVICSGAEDAEVRARLTGMISALTGIGSHRIAVLPLAQ